MGNFVSMACTFIDFYMNNDGLNTYLYVYFSFVAMQKHYINVGSKYRG